jgi:hypothetical protein
MIARDCRRTAARDGDYGLLTHRPGQAQMSAVLSYLSTTICAAATGIYRRRRPERTALYRLVQQHLETWLARAQERDPDAAPIPRHVERELRGFFECGILACGFARARCGACGDDFLVAFSCKGRGICPSCTRCRSGNG